MEEQNKLLKILPTVIIVLFGLSVHFKMMFSAGTFINEVSKILMALLGLSALLYTVYVHRSKKLFYIIGIYTVFVVLSSFFSGNYRFNDFILVYMYLGISLMISLFKCSYNLILLNFVFYSLFFLLILPFSYDGSVYMSVSRNYNSIIMIYNAILFYITAYQHNRKLKISPAIITLIVSLLSVGRSGIITAAILLFGVSVLYVQENLKTIVKYRKFIIFSIVALLILSLFFITQLSSALRPYLTRLIQNGIHDDVRSRLIKAYVENATSDLKSFLFGVPIAESSLFARWGFNLHNSYLRLHSLFGLGGVLSFLLLSVWSSIYYLKNNKLFFVLSIVVFVRISTDTAAFYGILDPMIFYLLFNYQFNNQSNILTNDNKVSSYEKAQYIINEYEN